MNKHALANLNDRIMADRQVTDTVQRGRRCRGSPGKPDIDPHDVLQIVMDLTGVSHLIKRLIDRYDEGDTTDRAPACYLVAQGSRKVFRVAEVSGQSQDTCPAGRFLGRDGYVESMDAAVSLAELRQIG